MVYSLRLRLLLSHILPLLVIVPLTGIALIYVLETQVLLPDLVRDLTDEADLIARDTSYTPLIWNDPSEAQRFVTREAAALSARLMLLSADGHLLASSDAADAGKVGQPMATGDLATAESNVVSARATYGLVIETEIADVLVPVLGPDQSRQGIVRLTYRINNVFDRFTRLRYITAGVLGLALLLGAGAGLVLALNIERPVRRITQAVSALAIGRPAARVPEEGPSELARLARAFNLMVERLQTLENARRQLLANLLHELGTPLGALRSGVQALEGGAVDDIVLRGELLAGIEEELSGLQRLLDDLVRHYDYVLGSIELKRGPVNPSVWLPRVLAPWGEAARRKGMHWETCVPSDLPTVQVDRDALGQALGNLVGNALKYTPAGGQVRVEAGMQNDSFWIAVADSGPGIAPADQERIFTPFFRVAQRARFTKGMGIGLSIARDLVAAHGGKLTVVSALGSGSRFTMTLPANPELIIDTA